ncbi:MAG: recombinase family protein, partial [Chloroflexota bacterium]|nr:recombinase family protein [Chloroflexota bacterium]
EGHSLDAQERLFRELCKNRGWEPVRVYREEGRSAHVEAIARRPVFRQLLEDAAKGQFDIVVVHTLDRWSRNLKVTLESLTILGKNNVGLASITENLDYTTPQGKLFTQMLGSFAEYFSAALAIHVSKGLSQRAHEGKHTGGIPFGSEACSVKGEKGDKICRCSPEHPGGIHVHPQEGPAVAELFARYASGTATLSQLAAWLNSQGFRTRNMHRLPDADGNLTSGPRLFTTASVRGILHNPFYTGKVQYKGKLLPGAHQAQVSQDVFDLVQDTLTKNSGRSETLQVNPEREYLLKGIIRCAYCGMPMWAQTYKNGHTYYREHKASRSLQQCPACGGSIPCQVADEQMRKLVSVIELGPRWLEEVLAIVNLSDEVERVKKERQNVQEKLRRMAKAYVDGLFPDEEYHRQKRLLEMELESLVVPQASAAEEAGKLLQDLPKLWAGANLEERRKLLLAMLDAVYVDAKEEKRIVAIKPKPPFRPVFQVAT